MSVDLPSPPGPTVRVTAPRGMRPFQAHSVFLGTMAEARVRVTTGLEVAAVLLGALCFFFARFPGRAISATPGASPRARSADGSTGRTSRASALPRGDPRLKRVEWVADRTCAEPHVPGADEIGRASCRERVSSVV